MPFVAMHMSALAVAGIFYLYRDHYQAQLGRVKMLRERIAYMLWTSAQQVA